MCWRVLLNPRDLADPYTTEEGIAPFKSIYLSIINYIRSETSILDDPLTSPSTRSRTYDVHYARPWCARPRTRLVVLMLWTQTGWMRWRWETLIDGSWLLQPIIVEATLSDNQRFQLLKLIILTYHTCGVTTIICFWFWIWIWVL